VKGRGVIKRPGNAGRGLEKGLRKTPSGAKAELFEEDSRTTETERNQVPSGGYERGKLGGIKNIRA